MLYIHNCRMWYQLSWRCTKLGQNALSRLALTTMLWNWESTVGQFVVSKKNVIIDANLHKTIIVLHVWAIGSKRAKKFLKKSKIHTAPSFWSTVDIGLQATVVVSVQWFGTCIIRDHTSYMRAPMYWKTVAFALSLNCFVLLHPSYTKDLVKGTLMLYRWHCLIRLFTIHSCKRHLVNCSTIFLKRS